LTSGEKAGFLAVDRDQIGLGQNLQQILGCSASMTAPKLMSWRNRKRFRTLLMVEVEVVLLAGFCWPAFRV
jgi:hypothetical protein